MNAAKPLRSAIWLGILGLISAVALTVMSVRTLVDEDRSVLMDLQLRLPTLQDRMDGILNALACEIGEKREHQSSYYLFPVMVDRKRNLEIPR
ncbi:MAG: hypothetical protein CME19_09400 [Gemmatimonadetes bacterium]|nr:hypothetical protein [Gemmatimonadota bacterium]|tara:strand:- start:122 stop:400 length:279 start_codon:yes stop_codon:yes gene_type:complete